MLNFYISNTKLELKLDSNISNSFVDWKFQIIYFFKKLNNENYFENEKFLILISWNIFFLDNTQRLNLFNKIINSSTNDLISYFKKIEWNFLILIYNKQNQNFILINDKLWTKPTWIYHQKNYLKISSNLDFLLNNWNFQISKNNLVEFISFWYFMRGNSIIKDLKNMQQWTIWIFENNSLKFIKYYNFKKNNINDLKWLYNLIENSIKKRTIFDNTIHCDLTWWFDTRLIGWILKKLYWTKKNIIFYTRQDLDQLDLEISQKISKKLNYKHILTTWTPLQKNEYLDLVNYKYDKIDFDWVEIEKKLTWLCWGEMFWNSILNQRFSSYQLDNHYWIDSNFQKIKKWIPNFLKHILGSHINTVQWNFWNNPTTYFNWNFILPFLDCNFLESLIGFWTKKLKNYKLYKQIYENFFSDLYKIEYTFNYEREKNYDISNAQNEWYLFFKNYSILKKQYYRLYQSNFENYKIYLDWFCKVWILNNCPLELYYLFSFFEIYKKNLSFKI